MRILSIVIVVLLIGSGLSSAQNIETGTALSPGNGLSFDFSTSNIPNAPPEWGDKCGVFVLGPNAGGALWYQHLIVESTKGQVASMDFMLAHSGMADETAISIAVAKAQHEYRERAPLAWRLYLYRTGGKLRFVFVIGQDGNESIWWYTPTVVPGVVYRQRITYDIARRRVWWHVNDQRIVDVPLTATNQQNLGYLVTGSSGSSTGVNTVFLLGRVNWQEIN